MYWACMKDSIWREEQKQGQNRLWNSVKCLYPLFSIKKAPQGTALTLSFPKAAYPLGDSPSFFPSEIVPQGHASTCSEHKALKAASFPPESPLQFWPGEFCSAPSLSPLVSMPAAPKTAPDSISMADQGDGMLTHATWNGEGCLSLRHCKQPQKTESLPHPGFQTSSWPAGR